jgi:ABC-type transport system substrate-binding protein
MEQQATDLLFESLVQARAQPTLGKTYRLQLAERLPDEGTHPLVRLRRDLYWSDGSRLTSADLRHTLLLTQQEGADPRSPAARELLQLPHFEGNLFRLELTYRQGALDPLGALTFRVLPQHYRGKPLTKADDAEFARAPLGSGPYLYEGRKQEGPTAMALFRANPYYVRAGQEMPGPPREIQLVAAQERWADLGQPLPHLVWDAPTDQLAALRRQGYTDVRTLPAPRVHYLAVNQRRPDLSRDSVRRALAHAIDRQALLDHHFRAGTTEAPPHHTANGLFPHSSWAAAPVTRVPAELYKPEQALALVKQVKADLGSLELSLKVADDDPRVARALTELSRQVEKTFADGGVKLTLRVQALPPRELRRARDQRDFDLLYQTIDHADEPYRLWALFDPTEAALRNGGSNFLGHDDAKLQNLLRAALQHRAFTELRGILQTAHAHLAQTMPLIPLWQLDTHVAVHASLRLPDLEALSLFADVVQWKLLP